MPKSDFVGDTLLTLPEFLIIILASETALVVLFLCCCRVSIKRWLCGNEYERINTPSEDVTDLPIIRYN